MYSDHDIPVLFTQLLLFPPWLKNGKYYSGGTWRECDIEQLGQAEAQVRHISVDFNSFYMQIVLHISTF